MGDFKSKIPTFQEITQIAGKLFKDVKNSVCEIVQDYKQKHPEEKKSKASTASSSTHEEKAKRAASKDKKPTSTDAPPKED